MLSRFRKLIYVWLFSVQAIVLISVASPATSLAASAPQSSCEDRLTTREQTKAVLRAFSDLYRADTCYTSNECHKNVLRLYRGIRARVSGVSASDFKVLIIGPKAGVDFTNVDEESGFHVTQARDGYVDGKLTDYIAWKYHVVLEYKGFILDLDNRNQPTAYPQSRYFRDFFLSAEIVAEYPDLAGPAEDLAVWTIPGEKYFFYSEFQLSRMDGPLVRLLQKYNPSKMTDFQRDPKRTDGPDSHLRGF